MESDAREFQWSRYLRESSLGTLLMHREAVLSLPGVACGLSSISQVAAELTLEIERREAEAEHARANAVDHGCSEAEWLRKCQIIDSLPSVLKSEVGRA